MNKDDMPSPSAQGSAAPRKKLADEVERVARTLKAEEVLRLAFIYAEAERASFADSLTGSANDREYYIRALALAKRFRDYRLKRWGKTKMEVDIEGARTVLLEDIASASEPPRSGE